MAALTGRSASLQAVVASEGRSLSSGEASPFRRYGTQRSGGGGEHYVFVPGRVCLFGEHSDWAGGYRRFNGEIKVGKTLVVGTNEGIHAAVHRHPNALHVISTDETGKRYGPYSIPFEAEQLLAKAREGTFFSYACGVAYHMLVNYRVSGLVIDNYKTDLPLKKGLSSSAAFCVLVARAFSRAYNLKLTLRGEMDCAYVGERLTPSKCGRMDQACAFGARPVLMTYDEDFLDCVPIGVPSPLHLCVVDLCAKKSTVAILRDLQSCYPFAKTDAEREVHRALGEKNHEIVALACDALRKGDAEAIGELMTRAQGVFDAAGMPVCEELKAPVLHRVLSDKRLAPFIFGGKGVGAGGDGTAQFCCKSYAAQQAVKRIIEEEMGLHALPLTVQAVSTVRRAVIPAAGFSASLFPATKVVTPPLFPVVDSDGVAKPSILIVVDELCRAGFDRIVIVVQEEDLPAYKRLFKNPLDVANYHRLTRQQRQQAKNLLEMGERVSLVVQDKQQGFAHAVHCAKPVLEDERFMVVLGDHIYRSHDDARSCCQQLVDACKVYCGDGSNLVGLTVTPKSRVSSFGAVAGAWLPGSGQREEEGMEGEKEKEKEKEGQGEGHKENAKDAGVEEEKGGKERKDKFAGKALVVTKFLEKPSEAEAERELSMPDLCDASANDGEGGGQGERDQENQRFLTIFGLYVINDPAGLWSIIENALRHDLRDKQGNFGFTDVLNELRRSSGLKGYVVDGDRRDIGSMPQFLPIAFSKGWATGSR